MKIFEVKEGTKLEMLFIKNSENVIIIDNLKPYRNVRFFVQ